MKFRLVRFFTLTSLVAFLIVTAILSVAQRHIAIENMVRQEEGSNVNLTKTFANSLWTQFKPFVANAGSLDGEALQAAPEQGSLYKEVVRLMRGLSVVKVKVYDLNGLTVFSTQASQIGDDKSTNAGFRSARRGLVASELTHRDTFSAFEETIEDRDVLSSYIPIVDPATQSTAGVFEIYSDVTPFLAAINQTTWLVVGAVVSALLLLYLALFVIVKRADGIIQQQQQDNIRVQSQLAQHEKMASLGQLVAGVAHELNTPLAFTRSNVSMIKEFIGELGLALRWGSSLITHLRSSPNGRLSLKARISDRNREQIEQFDEDLTPQELNEILDQTLTGIDQMAELVIQLKDFTRLNRAESAELDVNKAIKNVLYIAKSALSDQISVVQELAKVPTVRCMPSQINQVLINLITNAAQAIEGKGRITLRTGTTDGYVKIEVEDTGKGIPPEIRARIFETYFTTKENNGGTGLGLSIVRDIMQKHEGKILVDSKPGAGTKFTLLLPYEQAVEHALAA